MATKEVAPCGSWKSPITSHLVSSGAMRFDSQIVLSGDDTYWIESRPAEEGRSVVVRMSPGGTVADVNPQPFNARTRVHEYGGGAVLVDGATVYFSNFADQRIYKQEPGGAPRPITPAARLRFADGVVDSVRRRIICVCEDHTTAPSSPVNSLVGVDLEGEDTVRPLVSGNDFYSSPRISIDGSRLVWLTWNHPNMPWDYTELWLGSIAADGSVNEATKIAGGAEDSICQPRFGPDGTLYFVSERTGWWNLYRWRNGRAEALCRMEAEFGSPQWVFGLSNYAFESADRIVCSYTQNGNSHLARLDVASRRLAAIDSPYASISSVEASPGYATLIAGSPTEPASIVRIDLRTGRRQILRRSTEVGASQDYLSIPRDIEFPTEHGLTAHALYYPPRNREFAPGGEMPPLLIVSHGGPTSAVSSTLNLTVQYWTSRGFAVADVNYGGSSGYGRDYRQRLDGQWGIVDVDDCVNCARFLAERGEVDGRRLAIRGGSAGGYTTMAALTFRDVFKAGASYYGVSDLEALAKDTHKFESRYLDRLIGPYPARRDLYVERSPINSVDRLSCPVIFFQGDEDKVVPPAQAETMVAALRKKGIPVAYLLFAGEQHGFRKAENIKRALDAELYFYSRTFGFELPEPVDPVTIENQ